MRFYDEPGSTILCGHAVTELRALPPAIADCIITSPPYYGLRSYKTEPVIWDGQDDCDHDFEEYLRPNGGGHPTPSAQVGATKLAVQRIFGYKAAFCRKCGAWRGELGAEPTVELYITHLMTVMEEVKRALKDTGTLWVNIGDAYAGSGKGIGGDHGKSVFTDEDIPRMPASGLPAKSLCLAPERFALAMQERGWILRNTIIWDKSNPMPESVTDRFTGAYEFVYFFVKSNRAQYWANRKTLRTTDKQPPGTQGLEGIDWEWTEHAACAGKGCSNRRCVDGRIKTSLWRAWDYWFDQQFEAYTEPLNRWGGDKLKRDTSKTAEYKDIMKIGYSSAFRVGRTQRPNELGRNMRDVWEISTKPHPEAHFATFPEKLVEIPILAGCPPMICRTCGRPIVKIYKRASSSHGSETASAYATGTAANRLALLRQAARKKGTEYASKPEVVGYADCGCGDGFEPGTVLDPLAGRGTTGAVAKRLSRKYIGIEISPIFCEMGKNCLKSIPLPMIEG